MSKQIAILLDNSGSMFNPVGGANPNDKIYETARGAEFFIENLIDELAVNPDSDFAISIHRFASNYQVLPGGAQIDTSEASFNADLATMRTSIAAIENESASQAAVGVMTDLYDAVRQVSDYLVDAANQPGFGAPDSKVIFLFTDGLQTINHGGGKTMSDYETAESVTFENLLRARGIKMVAWGTGSDALGAALSELVDQAVLGGTNPVSDSKVLFPVDESGTFENCTAIIASNAIYVVSQNGVLPLRPAGQPPSGLLWEQFSLPSFGPIIIEAPAEPIAATAATAFSSSQGRVVNFKDFEVDVDGSSKELVLGLVSHARRSFPSIEATAPGGAVHTAASPGTRLVQAPPNVWALKIPDPEEGTWGVRVHGDGKRQPAVYDLMARGILKQFSLEASASPREIPNPDKVEIVAWARWDGEPARGEFEVKGFVLGGNSFGLDRRDDGSFAGHVEITRPGTNIVVVSLEGKLEATRASIRRIAFAVVLLGRATDPRFVVAPATFEQGGEYQVLIRLTDARFLRSSQVRFGSGIQVTDFTMLSHELAQARIQVASNAFVGERVPVAYHPQAECEHPVRVVESEGGRQIPGEICCLRFDASGRLVGVVLCDGREVCVKRPSKRLLKLLELARDRGLDVKITVDRDGCLVGVEICR